MTNPRPTSRIDLQEITSRNQTARHILAGFSAEIPALGDFWQYLETALTDTLTLTTELAAIRLDRANLLAAMHASIAAHAEGEGDPLSYLRDELDDPQTTSQRSRDAS